MKKSKAITVKHFIGKMACALLVVLGLLVTFSQESQAAKPNGTVPPVSSLAAKALSETQVGLSWSYSDAGSINGYSIERSQNSTSGFQTIATAASQSTSFGDAPLSGGKSYYYRMRAFKKTGKSVSYSSYSPVAAATTPVTADVTAPTVSISSPASGTTFTSAQTVSIAVSAQDNVGVSKVELYDGTTLMGTDSAAPYSFSWAITSANNGSHSFTAKAYDAAGNSTVSSPAGLNVNIASSTTTTPGSFEFSASAYSVSEGAGKVDITIKRVGGSAGAVTVDWRTNGVTATFDQDYGSFTWTTVAFADGQTQITKSISIINDSQVEGDEAFNVSLDNPTGGATLGGVAIAGITIKDDDATSADTTAPTVSISSPAGGTTYTSAQMVPVAVSAQDNVGVSKIELYDGATLVGTDSTAPYAFSLSITAAGNGTHSLTAKAYDAAGNSKISAATVVAVDIASAVSTIFYGYHPSLGANDDPYAAPYGGVSRYVDPARGANSGNGSISSPWKDLQYAMTHATAGDTIYLRGGVHNYGITINGNVAATQQKPLEVRSYPGEWAIIDGTNIANGNLVRLFNESWIIFRNFEIRNSDKTKVSNGIYAENLTDCEFHNIYMHNNNGAGFSSKELYRVKFYNCTAIDNVDTQTSGDSADGFSVTSGQSNYFYRCVAIGNSDDGYDFWAASNHYLEDCVSASNGLGTGGDGNGFKLGKPDQSPNPESRGGSHTLVRCIALKNRFRGYSENATINGSVLSGCIAYSSGQNWELPSAAHNVTNGVSFDGNGDKIGSSTNVVASKGQGFGGAVYVSDYESVNLADMNNQTAGRRFFYPVRDLF